MSRLLLLSIILVLSGCTLRTNEEIIKEYNRCKQAGMNAAQAPDREIVCIPPRVERSIGGKSA